MTQLPIHLYRQKQLSAIQVGHRLVNRIVLPALSRDRLEEGEGRQTNSRAPGHQHTSRIGW